MNEPKRRGRPPKLLQPAEMVEASPAQDFACRVWEGQSDSLPRKVRIARVQKALEKRGMTMEGVVL